MSLSLRPTISALLRNRTGALLVAVQIAVALAVLVNAIYIVHQRIEKMGRPTGMDDANLFALESSGFKDDFNYDASLREDMTYLRSLPGVVAASPTDSIPLSLGGRTLDIWAQPDHKGRRAEINGFDMDEQALKTLGARLIAGRDFRADEILPPQSADMTPELIVTRSVAQRLFPEDNALGRTVYDDLGKPGTIVGILDDMIGTGWEVLQSVVQVAIFPTRPASDRVAYLNDRAMEVFLITVTALLVAVACLGIFALATFNVSTRTKQIGTRRAVGARQIDIVRYFLVENALITTAGVVVGCLLALVVGYWLSVQYALPRLDLYYLVGGVLLLWTVSQLAAWQPARRAAAVPPSVATRTV